MQDLREHIMDLLGAILLGKSITSVPEVLDGLMSSMFTLLNLLILSQDGKKHVQVSTIFFFVRYIKQENLLFVLCLKNSNKFLSQLATCNSVHKGLLCQTPELASPEYDCESSNPMLCYVMHASILACMLLNDCVPF